MEPKISEAVAVLKLLDDDNRVVAAAARERMEELLHEIPGVLRLLGNRGTPPQRRLLKKISRAKHVETLSRALAIFTEKPATPVTLEEGWFLIARYLDPDLPVQRYIHLLDHWGHQLKSRVHRLSDPRDRLECLKHLIFDELEFIPDPSDYFAPINSYFHKVIDRRMGMPVTLGVVLILVAHRAGMPLEGVGLPFDFIVRLDTPAETFLLDPAEKGAYLSIEHCRQRLERTGFRFQRSFLDPIAPVPILSRILNNLLIAYTKLGNDQAVSDINQLSTALHS